MAQVTDDACNEVRNLLRVLVQYYILLSLSRVEDIVVFHTENFKSQKAHQSTWDPSLLLEHQLHPTYPVTAPELYLLP